MNKFLYALGRATLTFLVILLIGYGWAFFELKIMLKDNPEFMNYVFYQQPDFTMAPGFDMDDIVVIAKGDDFGVGDKVLYLNENDEYKIRTVTDVGAKVTTKCDNCSFQSEQIDKSVIVGKTVAKVRQVGKLINFFKQKWFLITLAVIGFALVIISQYIHETPKKLS